MPHVCVRYLYFVCNAPERHTERLSETEIENDAMSCDNVWNRSLVIMPCRANSIIINWLRVHQIEEHYAQRTTDSRSNGARKNLDRSIDRSHPFIIIAFIGAGERRARRSQCTQSVSQLVKQSYVGLSAHLANMWHTHDVSVVLFVCQNIT